MAYVMAAVQLAGGAYTSMNERKEGLEQRTELRVQAAQREQQAGQVKAYSTREGNEERRKARLAQSALIAKAAAGGTGTDGNVETLRQDIGAEGEYRALLAMYQGEERATALLTQADADRRSGDRYARAGKRKAATTVIDTASDVYDKYR